MKGNERTVTSVAGYTIKDIRQMVMNGEVTHLRTALREIRDALRPELGEEEQRDIEPTPPGNYRSWESYNQAMGDPLFDSRLHLATIEHDDPLIEPGSLQAKALMELEWARSEERLREMEETGLEEWEYRWTFHHAKLKVKSRGEDDV